MANLRGWADVASGTKEASSESSWAYQAGQGVRTEGLVGVETYLVGPRGAHSFAVALSKLNSQQALLAPEQFPTLGGGNVLRSVSYAICSMSQTQT